MAKFSQSHTADEVRELREKVKQLRADPEARTLSVLALMKKYDLNRYWVTKALYPEKIHPDRHTAVMRDFRYNEDAY